jgi:C4-dicarboxylate-specific signal transduction histidine kinase
VQNAFDAVAAVKPPGVTVAGRIDADYAVIEVADNGPGIAADMVG